MYTYLGAMEASGFAFWTDGRAIKLLHGVLGFFF